MKHLLRAVVSVIAAVAFGATGARAAEQFDYTQYESPPRPTPTWVKMVDLGEQDPDLKGYLAPAGVKVEVVAREPDVINPVGMRFSDDGSLLVIEWKVGQSIEMVDTEITLKDGTKEPSHQWHKDVPDVLKRLTDTDGDGIFDKTEVVMDDLQLPSSVLEHDGWLYFTTRGGVTRRRQSKPGPGSPYDISERIVQGLCGFNQHQASGLTMSPDGWLFVTSGDDDDHAEDADGKRVHLLRTGGVWRMRPDGTQLSIFARGFRNPYRDVVFDAFGNMFHVDNDNEDGSKFQGCRLMHVMEEADYGWRLKPTVRCCWPDHDRGAVWGERPGKMPSMLKTGRGAPAGLLCYQGTGFPEKLFHGLLIYPDVFQKNVRAYRVARDGSTFKVTEQFTLLESDDGLFRPCQALQGPDGSIYLCDWRTDSAGPAAAWGDGQHGRIWRLSWEGTPEEPEIERGRMDAWANIKGSSEGTLLKMLDSLDSEIRNRAANELARTALPRVENKFPDPLIKLLEVIGDVKRPAFARASALSAIGIVARSDVDASGILLMILADDTFKLNPELARHALEIFSRNIDFGGKVSPAMVVGGARRFVTKTADPAVRRAAALAYSRLATQRVDGPVDADARFLKKLLRENSGDDLFLRDGLLRAIEGLGKVGVDWIAYDARSEDEPTRKYAIAALEAMRTREAAEGIGQVLREAEHLTDDEKRRLLTAYRYIQVQPAVDPSGVAQWLESHPDSPPAIQAAALESIALMGQGDTKRVLPIVLKLLKNDNQPLRLAAIKVIGDQRLLAAAKPLVEALKDEDRPVDERRAILGALANLRGERRFAQTLYEPGVLGVTDELAALAGEGGPADLRADVLSLLAQLDFAVAQPLAMKLLESNDPAGVSAAINALGAHPDAAKGVAERFLDGKLKPELLPQVAAALQRHAAGDRAAEFAELRLKVLNKGLTFSDDPEGIARVEQLVRAHGDANRGRNIFLNAQKSGCITCHSLEGAGGQIGPDLTGISKNASIAKLVESIIAPSKEIKEGFEQYLVRTKDGQTYAGYRVSSDATRTVLRDVQGKDIVILKEDVDREVKSNLSLMPEGSHALLSLEELTDLVAFLADADAQAAVRKK